MHMQSIPQSSVNSASRGTGLKVSNLKNSDSQSICPLKEVATSETNEDAKDVEDNQIMDSMNDQD